MAVTSSTNTVVGVYDTMNEAEDAVRALQDQGFSRDEISLVAKRSHSKDKTADVAADAGLGAALGGIGGLLAGLAGASLPGIGAIVAGGPVIALLGGMGIGAAAGGIIGVLVEAGVPREQADTYAESVRRGHVLVTLKAGGEDRAERACEIMDSHGAVDVERRASSWRQRGWTGYNPGAEPLSADELRREREYYGAAEQQAEEWANLSEREKQGADPALAETTWPHREAHGMDESLAKAEAQDDLTGAGKRSLDLSADDRAFQNSNPQFGASIENNIRRTDPAVARAESGFKRAMESAVRSARRRARAYQK